MADQSNLPLWQAMDAAYDKSLETFSGRLIRAAEIRVVADWLVPKKAEPSGSVSWIRWMERALLRQLLLAEADRAEAGDG